MTFETLIPDAGTFLTKLKANNTRNWFQANKSDYEAAIKNPGQALGEAMAQELQKITGSEHLAKLFRVNRDVRFSKDKTPYNTHLHLLWTDGSGPGWFFGLSPDYVTAGCGIMGMEKQSLEKYRKFIDENGAKAAKLVSEMRDSGYRMDEAELKRVPAPFDKEHRHGELLKRKSFTIWRDLEGETFSMEKLAAEFDQFRPVLDLCREFS